MSRNKTIGALIALLFCAFAGTLLAVPAATPISEPNASALTSVTQPTVLAPVLVQTSVKANYYIPDLGTNAGESGDVLHGSLAASPSRTINRWMGAANGFHTKFDGFILSQLGEMVNKSLVQGGAIQAGNGFYKATSDFTQFAIRLDLVDSVGNSIDGFVKRFLSAIMGAAGVSTGGAATIFGIIAVLVIIASILRNARSGMGRVIREAGAIALILALVFGVAASALNHNPDEGEGYRPAPVTPGWFVKGINDSITWLAAMPISTFVGTTPETVWSENFDDTASRGGLGCSAYVEALKHQFKESVVAADPDGRAMVSVALSFDALWESTGLYVWATTQAGYQNSFAASTYCRILDLRTNGGAAAAATTYTAAANQWGANTSLRDAIMLNANTRPAFVHLTNEATAASIVAWAACVPTGFDGNKITWKWHDDWLSYHGGHEVWITNPRGWKFGDQSPNDSCNRWFAATTPDEIPQEFFIKGDSGWIADRTKDSPTSVRDFLSAVVGLNSIGDSAGVYAYAVGAFFTMIGFGFVSIAVIIAKVFLIMFIIALWFVVIGAMFNPVGMREQLAKTFNKFLGVSVFAAITSIIVMSVVLLTQILVRLGTDVFGPGNFAGMLWVGMSPVLAILMIHLIFKKALKLPSPLSIGGASAWSKAGLSGALGGGITAGAGTSRLGQFTTGMVRRAGSNITDSVMGRVAGGRLGGSIASRSSMAPARSVNKEALEAAAEAKANALKDKQDLAAARAEHRREHGVAAKGDIRGQLADVTGVTALRGEVASRKAVRAEAIAARRADVATRRSLTTAMREAASEKIESGTQSFAQATGSSAGADKRARWGVGTEPSNLLSPSSVSPQVAAEAIARGRERTPRTPQVPHTGSRAIQTAARIASAPGDALHAARRKAWDLQDQAGAAATKLVNSKAAKRVMNDAKVVASATRYGVEQARNTAAGQAAERTARVIQRGAAPVVAGAGAVVNRKRDNAALLQSYRENRPENNG
jgi:hypothetical protein